jgi:hypothetical protein
MSLLSANLQILPLGVAHASTPINAASAVVIAMTVEALHPMELNTSEKACAQITPTRLLDMQRLWRLGQKFI